jgi:dihydropteroate synthase
MGILNITPDSFSDGGKFFDGDVDKGGFQPKAESHLFELVGAGAEIIDIGGESTRPGSMGVGPETEWQRIERTLKSAIEIPQITVSVDTRYPETARLALECGANIINDVCGTQHFIEMANAVKNFDAHLIVTHNSRSDENFLKISNPTAAIISTFEKILNQAADMNFDERRIILDPGIGFGKTASQNLEIFKKIDEICEKFPNPVVCATSKKSFLREVAKNTNPTALSAATIGTTIHGFLQGCAIFRVHDVVENLAALQFARQLYER